MAKVKHISALLVSALIVGCGGGGGGETTPPTFDIGGAVSGLSGSGLVLQNAGGNVLAIGVNGTFAFTTAVASGSGYSVTVLTQPASPSQICVVSNGAGTVEAHITNVAVACTTTPATLALHAGDMGGRGNTDATGPAARFNSPSGIATDSSGNLYLADKGSHTIRKVTSAGMVTTFAGTAELGSTDANGPAARFVGPSGVATDSADNVYVTDLGNHTIRKVTPSGVVTTLAGTAGRSGSTDANGAEARFLFPNGIATDSAGSIYVAESSSHTVRKITPAGGVTTLAGAAGQSGSTDATGAAARFARPSGIATDSAGNVYVADNGNHTIRKITPAGVVTTLAGTAGQSGGTDATGAAARFSFPNDIATDSGGNVYVSDGVGHTIRKITPAGVVTTLAGTAGQPGNTDATGAAARFFFPAAMATDSAGNVYVADQDNLTIRKITLAGAVSTLAGTAGQSGSTDATGAAARFLEPNGIATDSTGNVYVADTRNRTIRKITPAGVVTTFAGNAAFEGGNVDGTGGAARFVLPTGIATDSAGNVYVSDQRSYTIRKITPTGDVTTLAGSAGQTGSTDATGAAARFGLPMGIATDIAGNVYVGDALGPTIRKITSTGVVTTLAGTAGQFGSADGTGPAASFGFPIGIATDSAGNVYVADNTIRKITPAGVVTTLAGTAGQPSGVATDRWGNVYVSFADHTVRKITPAGVVTTVVGVTGRADFMPGALPGLLGYPRAVAVSGTLLYIVLYNGVAVVQNRP